MWNKNECEKQNMSLVVKVHKKENTTVVTVCDISLLGTKVEDEKIVLDLSSPFYNGEEKEERIIGDLIRNADTINLVGVQAVTLGIEEGVIEKEQVKKVRGVPYAQASIIHE